MNLTVAKLTSVKLFSFCKGVEWVCFYLTWQCCNGYSSHSCEVYRSCHFLLFLWLPAISLTSDGSSALPINCLYTCETGHRRKCKTRDQPGLNSQTHCIFFDAIISWGTGHEKHHTFAAHNSLLSNSMISYHSYILLGLSSRYSTFLST